MKDYEKKFSKMDLEQNRAGLRRQTREIAKAYDIPHFVLWTCFMNWIKNK
jgi:hypothetical protein